MKLRQTKWIIGGALIAVGVGIVLATSLLKATQYYVTVEELIHGSPEYVGKELKVAGKVSAGSVQKADGNLRWRFRIEGGDQAVWVNYRGSVPDTFKEGADVVVTGTFEPTGEMAAVSILAKCASKYEERLDPEFRKPVAGVN
jgi:cytochrome c-type biogenesis protein CcmE